MKKILLLVFTCSLLLQTLNVKAQEQHFIYIQSESKEPFFLMMKGVNYSSSANGYLILSKLQSGSYDCTIGFAKDKYPEQPFSFILNKNDLGFSLQQFTGKGWGLMNLQDSSIILSGEKSAMTGISATPPTMTEPNTAVTKISKKTTEEGLNEVYLDKSATATDTIAILIPKETKAIKLTDYKTDCSIATNDDFMRTRLQMAAATTEADMIQIASKSFASKCFSTEQVKNLGALILSEENKLTFFLSAKPKVYDVQNFASLQSQFSKPSIIKQFKAAL